MPWYDNQLPVIGGNLIQIDQLKRQNAQDERRNALADIAMQRGEEQYQQQRQDRLSAEQRQQAEQALSRAQWARGKPKAVIERQFPEVTANFEKQTGIPWAQADEGAVAQFTDDSIARLATGLGMAPPQAEQGGAGFGNVNPGDYTPQSLAKYAQTRNFADLERQYAPQQAWVGNIAGGIGAIPRSGGGVGAPQMVITPDAQIAGDARAAAAKVEAEGKARAKAEREAQIAKKINDAGNVGSILDAAMPLVNVATGSYGGAAADQALQVFGVSLDGADAIAGLKIVQAQLMLAQPRMEGPQSDKDVQLYRDAAANIGNPNVPRSQKMAAVRMIRTIHAKYESRNGRPAPAPPAAGKSYKTKSGATVTISE